MNFKIGDRVARNDKPEEVYTVSSVGEDPFNSKPLIRLSSVLGVFNSDGFHLARDAEYRGKAIENLSKPTPFDKVFWEAKKRVAVDPNAPMIEDDEENAEEFEQVIRERTRARLMDGLAEKVSDELDYWDGVHLSEAIEKTTSTAQHPQAMWGIQ